MTVASSERLLEWACSAGVASGVLRGVLGEELTGTSNEGIRPDEGSLGHVLLAALAHSEWCSLSLLPVESVAHVFSLYAHLLLIISHVGVVVIILHLELGLGGWTTAADRQLLGLWDELSRDRDVRDSGETARVLDSASWVDKHSDGWSWAGGLLSPRLAEADLASTWSSRFSRISYRPYFIEV